MAAIRWIGCIGCTQLTGRQPALVPPAHPALVSLFLLVSLDALVALVAWVPVVAVAAVVAYWSRLHLLDWAVSKTR